MKKLTGQYVENLINKIMAQAETGEVKIKDQEGSVWKFFVQLENNLSTTVNSGRLAIVVRDKALFVENMKKYLMQAREFYVQDKHYFALTDTSFDEKLVLDLFINASNFELNNIEQFVNNRTLMLKDQSTICGQIQLGKFMGCDIVAEIIKNHSNLEAPYKFKIEFQKEGETFVLPSITFGKIADNVKMYAIQGSKEKQENKLAKQLDRYFRKANKGVDMEDEILSQISTNALISFVVFAAYQKEFGTKSFEAVSLLPVRYNTQLTRGEMMTRNNYSAKLQFLDKHDKNQFNMTNRFLNTVIRYAYHFNMPINFDETTENLILTLTKINLKQLNNIVHEIDQEITDFVNLNTDLNHGC